MKNKGLYFFIFSLLAFPEVVFSQQQEQLIQFSGIVVTGDSLKPIPFAHVVISKTGKGSVADFHGFFSLVVRRKDKITFSAMGFKKAHITIPDTLKTDRLTVVQILTSDTLVLQTTVIYPWPNKEVFRQHFIHDKVPEDIYAIARKNLEGIGVIASLDYGFAPDEHNFRANESYKAFRQRESNALYSKGQLPYNSLMNPLAWYEFVKALKRGDFKQKD